MTLDDILEVCNKVPSDFGGGSAFDKPWVTARLAAHLALKVYAEIGVYRGRSFFPLARAFAHLGGFSYGIDPYRREDAMEDDLPPAIAEAVVAFINTADYSAIYLDVLERQQAFSLASTSMLIRATSASAAAFFERTRIAPDMIHIDGNHDTKHALADVETYLAFLSDRGILVIDDINWDTVKPTLAKAERFLDLIHATNTYAILSRRSPHMPAIDHLAALCRTADVEALARMRAPA